MEDSQVPYRDFTVVPPRRAAGVRNPGYRRPQLRDLPRPLRGPDGLLRPGDDRRAGRGAGHAWGESPLAARRARLRGARPGRAGPRRALALRPLAGGAHRRRALRVRVGAVRLGPRAGSSRRGEALPRRPAPDRRVRLEARGRREALICCADLRGVAGVVLALLPALARRRLGQRQEPGLPAPPDREPRRGAPAGRPPRLRDRRHDGVGPRLAEPRRDAAGGAGRPPDVRPARRAARDLGPFARGPAARERFFSRAPPPWSPSSRSARCSRRSS